MKFDEKGRELPDGTPMEIPVGMKRPESLQQLMKRMLQQHELHRVQSDGDETFEEANDFDMDDDDAELFPTHHELHEEVVDEVKRVQREREATRGGSVLEEDREVGRDGQRIGPDVDDEEVSSYETNSSPAAPLKKRSPQRRRSRRREEADTAEDSDSE